MAAAWVCAVVPVAEATTVAAVAATVTEATVVVVAAAAVDSGLQHRHN